jgi:glycosyltransferase involved in cell wall biosynthesis
VARFIAVSHAVKNAMVCAGIEAGRIDVVHSGVPTPTVTHIRDWRAERGWPSDSVIVGVVGAMTAEKGVALIEDVARALPTDAAQRTRIVFLGGAHAGSTWLGNIEAFHAGFVTEIYNAMAGLDLLWHPALNEGLGTALIDALALGVPPIAFAVGGIPEIVENGTNGLLVPASDIRAFAQAHVTMLDGSVRTQLASTGPVRAAHFSVEQTTQNTIRVYEKVLTA